MRIKEFYLSDSQTLTDVSIDSLLRVFTVPENAEATLNQVDRELSLDIAAFLNTRVVATEKDLAEIEAEFASAVIPEEPVRVTHHVDNLMEKLVAHSVNTYAPGFIGHMTSALPYFMLPLSKIMVALNQNVVKTETSKAFTPMERQVLGMMHHLVFARSEAFYRHWLHHTDGQLGAMCSGGTVANITALWVARNRCYGPKPGFAGIAKAGWSQALAAYGDRGAVVLVSERGHYSLSKAADVLGIGRDNIRSVPCTGSGSIDIQQLSDIIASCHDRGERVISLVAVAGSTETGCIDGLDEMAVIAEREGIWLHVDAAWGGPALFSDKHRSLLKGIERADSVTIDAHKQMYVPMGVGMVLFRDAESQSSIRHHANYIIRQGSKDLGSSTLEGSRPAMSMLVHAGLHIFGRRGYGLLVENNIQRCKHFSTLIDMAADFELVSAPVLNILTYRYVPAPLQRWLECPENAASELSARVELLLNQATQILQRAQRERGQYFVSRTSLPHARQRGLLKTVFRVVLANPLTTDEILTAILQEQRELAAGPVVKVLWQEIEQLTGLALI